MDNIKRTNRIPFVIIILLQISVGLSCQNKKNLIRMPIQYIPKEFHDVELGYYESMDNICTPRDESKPTEYFTNKIFINIPQKIIYNFDKSDFKAIIPVCGVYSITDRRAYKYAHLSAEMFHIRKVDDENWYLGEIIDPVLLSGDMIVHSPFYYKQMEEKEKKIIEAQKYSDEELDDADYASGETFNLNLMEYVDIPLESGIYEIYYSLLGLDSNHVFVEIIFEGEQKSFDPHQEKLDCSNQATEIQEEELPEI